MFTTSAGVAVRPEIDLVGHELSTGYWISDATSSDDGLITTSAPITFQPSIAPIVPVRTVEDSVSTSYLIQKLHGESGLTWEQLARLFGVSRRALHLWASGGRLNAANEELLVSLVSLVGGISEDTPAGKRVALLRQRSDGKSLYDHWRSRQRTSRNDINKLPFSPRQLLGANLPAPESNDS